MKTPCCQKIISSGVSRMAGLLYRTDWAFSRRPNQPREASAGKFRIARFTHAGSVANPASEFLVWENPQDTAACCHYGGGLGFGPGRYPRRAAKEILRLLEHVEHNAEYGGLDTENVKIIHMTAYRGRVFEGRMPRAHGRATQWNTETVNIEIIVEEIEQQ